MRALFAAFTLCLIALPATAQWAHYPLGNLPRRPDGAPDLSAPAPRTTDGRPDLSGVWWVRHDGAENDDLGPSPKYLSNLAADLAPHDVAMRPWADAFLKEQSAQRGLNHPMASCLPPGIPLSYTVPLPFKIVQTPSLVVMLYEAGNTFRQVFTDGRGLAKDPNPSFYGYSVGRWDDDAFVVESSGFNDRTWLDGMGHPHTEALRIIERYRRRDAGHLEIEITIDDHLAYARPWTVKIGAELLTGTEVMEYVCVENEKSRQHMPGRTEVRATP